MPKDRHCDASIYIERGEQRTARAARVVNLDLPDFCLLQRVKTAFEVPPLDRRAGA